jgi:hypothetical protein
MRGHGHGSPVLTGHPADEPDLDLVVQAQALEDALGRVVADQMAPALGVGGEAGHDAAQLGAPEDGGGGVRHRGKQST